MVTARVKRNPASSPPIEESATPERRRFTVAEYERMAEVRILRGTKRTELLDGEIYCMAAMKSPHASCLTGVTDWWYAHRPDGVILRIQTPINLSMYSMPEPDLAVVRTRSDRYRDAHPVATDVLLLIEVSDTTLGHDRGLKRDLYADAGIAEYWIFALTLKQILVHRKPVGGRYTEVREVGSGGSISPLAWPDLVLHADEILG